MSPKWLDDAFNNKAELEKKYLAEDAQRKIKYDNQQKEKERQEQQITDRENRLKQAMFDLPTSKIISRYVDDLKQQGFEFTVNVGSTSQLSYFTPKWGFRYEHVLGYEGTFDSSGSPGYEGCWGITWYIPKLYRFIFMIPRSVNFDSFGDPNVIIMHSDKYGASTFWAYRNRMSNWLINPSASELEVFLKQELTAAISGQLIVNQFEGNTRGNGHQKKSFLQNLFA